MSPFIGAIDQGTTSTRFLIFDTTGAVVAQHQVELTQRTPHPGWLDHDPEEIIETVNKCIEAAVEDFEKLGHSPADIKSVGITNQRETTVLWDARTGKALYHAVVWPDTRTTKIVHELRQKKNAASISKSCGLPLSTYPSAVKLVWLLRHVDAVKEAADDNRLAFGTVDSWIVYKLTGSVEGQNIHVTDPSNASRTMFMDIKKLEYSQEAIDFFEIQKVLLPKIVPSSDPESYGTIASGALKGCSIGGCLGDQSAALVGQCAFEPGMAKNTYGTGCFLLYNTGEEPVFSSNGLLTTVGCAFKGMKPIYALEGSIAVAGSAVKFLRDNLGLIKESNEIGELAAKVEDSGGVVFVTGFSGLFAPYWIDDARGTIFGITSYTRKEHICRATIEAICFQTKAILDAMAKDSGKALESLAVDGGMSNSDVCMQLQADIVGIRVDRPAMRETTALGAAIAAGFASGVYKSFDELKQVNKTNHTLFSAKMSAEARETLFGQWEKAVNMSKGWMDDSNAEEYDRP